MALSSHVLWLVLPVAAPAVLGQIALPTSKQLAEPVPGGPQRLNSLPMTAAISPDGRYLAVVNAGYGTFESLYQQSIAVLDIQTGKVTDFPEPRTAIGPAADSVFRAGLRQGRHASVCGLRLSDRAAREGHKDETGNAIRRL